MVGLRPIPAVTGWNVVKHQITSLSQRDRQPFTHTANRETPINFSCMSVDGARKSENTHTHTHKTATGGRKEEVICPEHCVFIFLKTDFVFGVWRKWCVSVWFSNCEIQDFNRQWSSALICIFSSREIMSSLWIDGEKVILWWINLFSPVYGDKNNENK